MQISVDDDGGSTARVVLVGKLDITGAEEVALPLATLSGGQQNVMIDMSGVTFLASIGIRHLVSATKALSRRGGRLILISPTALVSEILTTAGLTSMFSIVASESEAQAVVAGRA